jgi:hypothetical protein
MQLQKLADIAYTAFTGICSIRLFVSVSDMEAIYSMFVQSLIGTAAIGKILWDILSSKQKKDRDP